METIRIEGFAPSDAPVRRRHRELSEDAWIDAHASGTLRKNRRIGFATRAHYLHERVAYEWGWGWECVPRTHVTVGDAQSEGDCSPVTEAGWHIERAIALNPFPNEDILQVAYLTVTTDNVRREGIGMVLRQTSAAWIPTGHVVFALVAELDPCTHTYHPARNPA